MAHVQSEPMVTDLSWGAPLTEDDLARMPDDGHRYELIDGVLIVSPSPRLSHQVCVGNLHLLLHAAKAPGDTVLMAPFDVRLSALTVVIPDLLVARTAAFTPARLETAPLLVVEVRSPSTRLFDLGTKRLAYEGAGVPAYWIVDPDAPSLTVLRLHDGHYIEEASVTGGETYAGTFPFPVTVVPAALLES